MDNYESNNNYNYDNSQSTNDSYYNYNAGATQYADPYSRTAGMVNSISLNKVLTKSFLFMMVALVITAFASLTTSPATAIAMLTGGSFIILLVAELAIVFAGNWAIQKNNAVLAAILYTIYSFLTGMTLSIIYLAYTGGSIVATFFVTAGMFAVMAIIGAVTKKDLTKFGSMCMMGLIGIILAGIVNMFIGNTIFDLIISVVGVVIFVGLTAYDTQKIKNMAAYATDATENSLALFGAFQLYLDFINLFLKLLRLFGKRK